MNEIRRKTYITGIKKAKIRERYKGESILKK